MERSRQSHNPVRSKAPFNSSRDQETSNSSKIWNCGDPYIYPIPMPNNSNCWKGVLDPHIKNDKVQCDAWKDEVQNLLIFAGLFSAVVTSFTVESYRSLQADPNDTIIYLLNRLVETSANISTPTPQMQPFMASSLSIRVNVFWFLSLILSLITVLIGIVALQWLREHQKYTDQVNSRAAASVFQMRSLGLNGWYIDHIFTGLPLLLQGALILFLIGMVDFLGAQNKIVAGWVATAVTFALLFFVMTTALPTLQLFIPLSKGKPGTPVIQCPYRSPQSWIFFLLASDIHRILHIVQPYMPFERLRSWIFGAVTFHFFQSNYQASFVLLCDFRGWIHFDSWWCNVHEVRMNRGYISHDSADLNVDFYGTFSKLQDNAPTQLEAELLLNSIQKYSQIDDMVFALYHCMDEVATLNSKSQDLLFERYYTQAAAALPEVAYWPTQLMAPFTSSSPRMMREVKLVWFLLVLGRQGHSKNVEAYIASHLIELKSRITAYTLSPFRHVTDVGKDIDFMDYTEEYIHYALRKKDGNYLEHKSYGEVVFRYPVSNDLYRVLPDL
ncbi:hypothetical protein GALMADRAFT_1125098 [Galerina marginata CBS 339.88]|uniref:DUF6535 domain-containing protein n=1 Tax=Galerina marginata (strain CBS 339.88) TaxID=685588 RepID=A0A067TDP3_GALM3|nr:hypothetical protein GALMADRAFT_1125098 [Galerina marginata CBS 339.88]